MHILELFGCTQIKFRSDDVIGIKTSAFTVQEDFQTGTHC